MASENPEGGAECARMRLERITYRDLTAKQREMYNSQKVIMRYADRAMTPYEFIDKWRASALNERPASQERFIDLCPPLGEPTPARPTRPARRPASSGAPARTPGTDMCRTGAPSSWCPSASPGSPEWPVERWTSAMSFGRLDRQSRRAELVRTARRHGRSGSLSRFLAATVFSLAGLLAGCGDDQRPSTPTGPTPVVTSPSNRSPLRVGAKITS